MMAVAFFLASLMGATPVLGAMSRTEARLRKNPIRKVVTMLQDMQKSVEEEGEKETELYDKFMCYCKTQGAALADSISDGQARVEALTGDVTDKGATKAQLEQEIEGHKADRAEAERQVSETTALRKKEEADFQATSGEMKANIQAMGSALEALSKSGAASAAS